MRPRDHVHQAREVMELELSTDLADQKAWALNHLTILALPTQSCLLQGEDRLLPPEI